MAAHARLKNEFTEDEKYHNLMSWLSMLVLFYPALLSLYLGKRAMIALLVVFLCVQNLYFHVFSTLLLSNDL